MNIRKQQELTFNERFVLAAIRQGYETPYRIQYRTDIKKHDVGEAIASLANKGLIKQQQIDYSKWELCSE